MPPSELDAAPRWKRTGNAYFPVCAQVDGHWWVLRINSFPDHALWTLFVDGSVRFDLDDAPPSWGRPAAAAVLLDPDTVRAVLEPVEDFVAYGAEVGTPCDNPYCCG